MDSFRFQCVNYLQLNCWTDEGDGTWSKHHPVFPHWIEYRHSIGAAIDQQLEWDDEYDADTRVD